VPVLLRPLLAAVAPVSGLWLDGTFGAGGYARGLLEAGAARVIGVDRDPSVFGLAAQWAGAFGDRLRLVEGTFSDLDTLAGEPLDGVVLDLGVSSMQLDQPERGFSFMKDGPLDMRMSGAGPSAADLVNAASEAQLADIIYHYGEDRAARRIARAIVRARETAPILRGVAVVLREQVLLDADGALARRHEHAEAALARRGAMIVRVVVVVGVARTRLAAAGYAHVATSLGAPRSISCTRISVPPVTCRRAPPQRGHGSASEPSATLHSQSQHQPSPGIASRSSAAPSATPPFMTGHSSPCAGDRRTGASRPIRRSAARAA
jgi:hypothetical protein